jgi:hypothetical protein
MQHYEANMVKFLHYRYLREYILKGILDLYRAICLISKVLFLLLKQPFAVLLYRLSNDFIYMFINSYKTFLSFILLSKFHNPEGTRS